jgi:hypothetical protein
MTMTDLTNTEIQNIKNQIDALSRKAESGEQFAEICYLQNLLSSGPWFNGLTQEKAVSVFRGWMTVEA